MQRAEIDALVRAHGGRVRAVASFHVLRQATLDPDDLAFLARHAAELGPSELLRWRSRCEPGFTAEPIRALARVCAEDPTLLDHEILEVPRLDLDEDERRELCDLLRGKVPEERLALLRGRRDERRLVPSAARLPLPVRVHQEPEPAPRGAPPLLDPGPVSLAELLAGGASDRDDAALARLAMERALADAPEDWSRLVRSLPFSLREAALVRARRTPRDGERANLLGWLAARDHPRAELIAIALEPVGRGAPCAAVLSWLSSQLVTRAAWERHGEEVLSLLLERAAYAETNDVVTASFAEAALRVGEVGKGFVEAVHSALALALVGLAERALATERDERALAALSALVCLDPPARVSARVHDLTRHASSPEAADLAALGARLVRHGRARDATFESLIASVHLLSEALGTGSRSGPRAGSTGDTPLA